MKLVAMALGSRVAVLAAGYLAVVLYGYHLEPPKYRLHANEVWNLPARWDAGWYLGIARRGYQWHPGLTARQQSVAFFPAFPALMRVAGEVLTLPAHVLRRPDLFGNGNTRVTWGGVLINVGAFALAVRRLSELGTLVAGSPGVAFRACVLVAAWPFALFFSAAYSEGLFLLAAVSSALALIRDRPIRALLWGMLAGLARSNGWAVAGTLAALAIWNGGQRRRWPALLAAPGPVAGALIFSAYLWSLTGHPFVWIEAQAGWGRAIAPLGFITERLAPMQAGGVMAYVSRDPSDAVAVICVIAMGAGAFVCGRRYGYQWTVFPVAYLLPAMLINLPAVGRMTAVLFPAFLGLAAVLTGWRFALVAGACALLQLWLAARFFTWQHPF